ncbi:HD-GYP domain-containing protein [Thermoanaerobacterium thermosaccharolyticum]|uniref:HD domain-containing phosphohydrolase n=1 Tax=Thermoanaerobacterium thermosaccharolyticum TaxID=1517 RepID=UPI003DA88D56
MLTYFDNINGALDLTEMLSNFKTEFDINCLSIFLVDQSKIYCIKKIDAVNDTSCCYPSPVSRDNHNNNIIYFACNSLKPLYHIAEDDDTIVSMEKDIVEEVCIPVKIEKHKDITVCIYFGFNYKAKNITELLSSFFNKFNLFDIYYYALVKYDQLADTEKILKFLMVFEDSIKSNQPSMKMHPVNVAFWSIEIAKKLNFTENDLEKLYYAALYHDIGKIKVKNSIINKEGPLTEEEYEEVKRHAEYGYIITKELIGDIYPDIPLWVRDHHEKYDGSGYPNGLKDTDIPLSSRIIKVADVIDVLYSPRSYKKSVSVDKIIDELKRCCGKDFDPQVVDAAIEVINEKIIFYADILNLNNEEVLPANLSLNTYKGIFNYDGYFYSKEGQSYFKCTNAIEDVQDLWDILSASLIVEKLNSVYEYEVEATPIDENTYLLSKIRSHERRNSVSILWDLKAKVLTLDGKDIEVRVARLSADYLLFVCDNTYSFNTGSLVEMKLLFEDGEVLTLNGRITYSYSASAASTYYKYTFINIGEMTRDKLFRQIFRKQINLRKQLKFLH